MPSRRDALSVIGASRQSLSVPSRMPGSNSVAAAPVPAGPARPANPIVVKSARPTGVTPLAPTEPTPLAGRYDVAVVGGGVTGCATAYHLARAGARVVLLERSEIGTEASGRNAGSLHGQIQSVSYNERGASWARAFLPALGFVVESLSLWRGLSEQLGVDLEVKTNGGLLLVDDAEQMKRVEQKIAIEREGGLDARLLSRDEVMGLAPYIASTMIGAEYSPVEGKVNSMLAAPAFARRAVEAGAEIRTRTAMLGLDPTPQYVRLVTEQGETRVDQVVLASGDQLSAQAADLGARVPISSEPVQVAATEPVEPLVEHLVYYAGAPLTLKQARAGSLLIRGRLACPYRPGDRLPARRPAVVARQPGRRLEGRSKYRRRPRDSLLGRHRHGDARRAPGNRQASRRAAGTGRPVPLPRAHGGTTDGPCARRPHPRARPWPGHRAVPGRPVFEPLTRALDGGHTYRCRAYFVKRHQTMSARYVCDMRTIARLTNDLPQRRVRPDPGGPGCRRSLPRSTGSRRSGR